MYGTVYHPSSEESSNPMDHALRSISEATTEFVDWLSGSQQDYVNDDPRVEVLVKDTSERSSVSTMGSSSSFSYGSSSSSPPRLSEGSTASSSPSSSAMDHQHDDPMYHHHHDLSFTQDDVSSIVYDDSMTFRQLQKALRNKGCVTNTYLQQNLHHYVYHLKQFQREEHSRRQRQQQRLKQQALAGRRHQAKYMAPPTVVVAHQHHHHHHQHHGPNQTSSIAA